MIGWWFALGCTSGGADPVQVFAAASLTDAFTAVEADFEEAYPDTPVDVTFAGSQILRMQIEHGAPAHVFASANRDHAMDLSWQELLSLPVPFARNALVVIVAPGNPAAIHTFDDLPNAQRLLVATDTVPLGRYTQTLLDKAPDPFAEAVRARVVSTESNARLVRAKVLLGEADAAIVYATDAVALPAEQVIRIPDAANVSAEYVLGTVPRAPGAARAFADFVRSPAGRARLTEYGFSPY